MNYIIVIAVKIGSKVVNDVIRCYDFYIINKDIKVVYGEGFYMVQPIKKIALLTGGGDCPGLNAVIRAITRAAILNYGIEVIGYRFGYKGLYHNNFMPLTMETVTGILHRGGTILYSSNKDNLFDYLVDDGHGGKVKKDVSDVAVENLKKDGVDVLVILGGDGTLTSARDFSRKGVNVIGVPKTMDNDLASTDVTYGFISAMSVGTEFIDRLQTTAKSHHRVICCELMGRDAGWITLYAGLAGNAGVCLIPEIPFTIENIAKAIKKRDEMGLPYTVVAVAEGAKYADGTKVIGKIVEDSPDPVRYSGLAAKVADDLEKVIPNHEVRSVNPGHIIRGGDITAYDRILSIRYGVAAVELINECKFGNVVTINGDKMGYTSLEEVIGAAKIGQQKHVDPNGELVKAAKAIGISFGDE